MTDDLITRLRDVPQGFSRPMFYDDMEEAAARIEKLEAALRKIAAPYDRDGCTTGERYADAVWIAKAALTSD